MNRLGRILAALSPMLLLSAALAQPAPPPPAASESPAAPSPAASESPAAPSPAASRAPSVPAFPVEEMRLSNGLQVLLAPDSSLPNVAVVVKYHVGTSDEPDGLHGIAHLVEHLTFERSSHLAPGAHLRVLANAGAAELNGQTGSDSTYYHEVMPPERLELALWLESDRMGYFLGAVDEEALEQERNVVLTELRMRVNDQPGGLLSMATLDAALPSWHPYHAEAEAWEGDTRKITLQDIRAFFATWYGPENATLLLCGHFDLPRTRRLVEKYFGTLPGRPPPKRPALPKIERRGPTRLELGASVREEEVELSWVTPAYGLPGDTELDWLAAILARGAQSRLEKSLVNDGLALSVHARQSSRRLTSLFVIRALAAKGHTAEELIRAIDEQISSLSTLGPSEREMERAASYWELSDLFSLEDALGRASVLMSAAGRPGPLFPLDWREHRGSSPSASDLRAVVSKYLSPEARAAEVILRPKKGAPLAGTIVKREEP